MGQVRDRNTFTRYERELRLYLHWYHREALGLPVAEADRLAAERLARTAARRFADVLDQRFDLAGIRMLEVGSGCGELLFEALELGADAHGVATDPDEVEIANLLLRSHGHESRAIQARVEELPFPDDAFDLVTCREVLAEAVDAEQVVAEIVRVARPGANIVVSVPNSLFPYEPHYRMLWIPMLPRPIGKYVLRARGRNPWFLERVNSTTYPNLMRLWRRHNLRVRQFPNEAEDTSHNGALSEGLRLWRLVSRPFHPTLTFLLEKPARGRGLRYSARRREQPVEQGIRAVG